MYVFIKSGYKHLINFLKFVHLLSYFNESNKSFSFSFAFVVNVECVTHENSSRKSMWKKV